MCHVLLLLRNIACVDETSFIVTRLMYTHSTYVQNKKPNEYGGLTNIALGGFHAYLCNIWSFRM